MSLGQLCSTGKPPAQKMYLNKINGKCNVSISGVTTWFIFQILIYSTTPIRNKGELFNFVSNHSYPGVAGYAYTENASNIIAYPKNLATWAASSLNLYLICFSLSDSTFTSLGNIASSITPTGLTFSSYAV